jgi:isocitrate dehydrogenase kinase/phosphatase
VRRILLHDGWRPVDYSFGATVKAGPGAPARDDAAVIRSFPAGPRLTPETVIAILRIPGFTVPYQDLKGDAALVAERVNRELGFDGGGAGQPGNPGGQGSLQRIEMLEAGFFRNQGAYVVGRVVTRDGSYRPLVLALDNDPRGIFVDAVLTKEAHIHNIFSSTLANFHVTNTRYHELAAFLHSIMPRRPLGLHHSTIGFNHVGKVAAMNELRGELLGSGEVLDTAIGFRGTVAIGFSAPSSAYVLKVIRDQPTAQYKWGAFGGVEAVLNKYHQVHEINRTGSMLDNIIYRSITLERSWFADELRDELLRHAGQTVSAQDSAQDSGQGSAQGSAQGSEGDGGLVFRHLIVQPKMVPLPLVLETASPRAAGRAMRNLGHCIRNNAAANIFNKDLDARNYGVSQFLKVYLFDYDAIEPLTEVKIRSNAGRIDGDEDPPDWVFEDGVVFLPEEIEAGLRIDDRDLRRQFRDAHGDLLTTDYWEGVQRALSVGTVPRIRVYPESTRLRPRRVDISRV